MSPNMKFDSVSVVLAPPPASVAVAVRLCSSNDGGAAGSSTRQVVILPSAWSGNGGSDGSAVERDGDVGSCV